LHFSSFIPLEGNTIEVEQVANVIAKQPPFNDGTALLLSHSHVVKTTLLFQYAYKVAAQGRKVAYILEKTKIHTFAPLFNHGFTPEEDILAKIEIRHLGSARQLQYYFASLHLQRELPQLIIVDNFVSFFISQAERPEMFKTLAFIKEAADYASQAVIGEGKNECAIIIGDVIDPEGSTRRIDLFEHWTPLIFLTQGQHTPFSLVVHKINREPAPKGVKAVFHFDANEFSLSSLEMVTEDGQKIFAQNSGDDKQEREKE